MINPKHPSPRLVGGVNSPVRAFRHIGGEPLLIAGARGAILETADGRTLVDFVMGWGPLILGHGHARVVQAVRDSIEQCDVIGLTHPLEIDLAERVCAAVDTVEQVRFVVSGTEAVMTAVRLARGATGRAAVLRFEGDYHGHSDSMMAGDSAGIPEAVAAETLRAPYNDASAVEKIFNEHGKRIAAVVVEPVAANMGVIPPEPGFLEALRALCTRHGALLIFDEVVTGFRLGLGGAQRAFNIQPDLSTFGKIVGGGYPIGAVGGPRDLMRHLAPEGKVYHGGTFAGHPASMAAGKAALDVLREEDPYAALETMGAELAAGLAQAAQANRIPAQVNRAGSTLTLFFSEKPVRNWQDVAACDKARYARFCHSLLKSGILAPPSPYEGWFLSVAHTAEHVSRVIDAASEFFASEKQAP